jgi:hypothetical protein
VPEGAPKSELISTDASSATPCPQCSVVHPLRRAGDGPIATNTPGTLRRRPKPLPNRGTPMRPNPRPPLPKKQLPGAAPSANPDANRPRNPVTEVTRGGGAPVHDAPESERRRNRRMPLRRGPPGTQEPSHRCKQRRPSHIRRRRSRRLPRQSSTDATAALSPPAGSWSTCDRCWSEDHRTLGATSPRRGAATAQPKGDDRGEPRTPNRRPATTARSTRR